jgi:hypothetical protein
VVDRFWQIDKDGPSGTATLTFTATPAEIGSISTLLAQRWDASTSKWQEPLPNQVSTATGVTVPDVSTFSPWTLSSSDATLPIELIDFTASANRQTVDINWKANTEINNDYFTIQRSRDGMHFTDIGKIPGAGTSYISTKYKYTDTNVLQGRWYYRLMQTDFDGKSKSSDIKRVDIETTFANDFVIYPNPVSDKFTFQGVSQYQITAITVLNGQGTLLGVLDYDLSDGMYSGDFDLSNNLPGLYIIRIGHDHGADYLKVIKQ